MKPAAPGDTQPLSPLQPPLRLLRWQARTQVFHEELGGAERLTMVRIPPGSFQMGSAEQEPGRHANEGPVHSVTLAEFLIGQTPITQAQWRAVARWEPQKGERWGRELNPEPSKFQGEETRLLAGETNADERPMERVSWLKAMEFCSRLSQRTKRNYTLPSEAQWEYACRAGTASPYAFGSAITAELANLRLGAGLVDDPLSADGQQTTSVRLHPANAWGLHAMHGNVGEWCRDHWHDSYSGAPADGTAWIDAKAPLTADRVVRGGAWSDLPSDARSACRYRLPPQTPESASVGLRVVCLPGGVGGERGSDAGDQSAREASDRQACVVWIDDHHDNNRSERALLADEGIRFILADSNDEVLGLIASGSVDLVISDMSRHNDHEAGLKLLKLLRSRNYDASVIFYVGNREAEAIGQAVELGAAAVINQPAELIEAVQIELAGNKVGPVKIQRAKCK
jgi:formylglycine-generating enzyme required for sulfatase activity/CheY-like chemotaxis protein